MSWLRWLMLRRRLRKAIRETRVQIADVKSKQRHLERNLNGLLTEYDKLENWRNSDAANS